MAGPVQDMNLAAEPTDQPPPDKPLFRRFTVAETLRLGRELNPGWDQRAAEDIVRAGNVPFDAKINTLSGGQRTRALTLAPTPAEQIGARPRCGTSCAARERRPPSWARTDR